MRYSSPFSSLKWIWCSVTHAMLTFWGQPILQIALEDSRISCLPAVCQTFLKRNKTNSEKELNPMPSVRLQAVNSIHFSKDIYELCKQVLTTALSSTLLKTKPSSTRTSKASRRKRRRSEDPKSQLGNKFYLKWAKSVLLPHMNFPRPQNYSDL